MNIARIGFWWEQILSRFIYRKQLREFYLVLGGHIFFQTLNAAAKLDLFSLLEKHKSLSIPEISELLHVEQKPIRILVLGLTSLGLIKKKKERYTNTFIAKQALTSQSKKNVLPIIAWQHHINYKPMHSFYKAILANGAPRVNTRGTLKPAFALRASARSVLRRSETLERHLAEAEDFLSHSSAALQPRSSA